MTKRNEISASEWEVMRLLWSLQQATSSQLHQQLEQKFGWKMATTKTLLGRLVTKKVIAAKKNGRAYLYYPLVTEQKAVSELLNMSLEKICQRCRGQNLAQVLADIPLSKQDIALLKEVLKQKEANAPTTLECNCVVACHCQEKMPTD
ncbi:CopY/TcrY family copper transport repressor [Ligilactobacillus sp. Marseille-Q7487]|uniref:CopY/TcrY family copper transport repressor n=1 Tax=Ligilactobacillus sp. Marseille-Q7487 TaxID=3022128 RepID=UPI0024A7B278|nr:CopY/TcrY family copper transport repressor [Ligilactobacillus sp. Marseille-Q7487]